MKYIDSYTRITLALLVALTASCNGGGGGGDGGTTPPPPPPPPTTSTISGYITIPGTTMASAPVSVPAAAASTSLSGYADQALSTSPISATTVKEIRSFIPEIDPRHLGKMRSTADAAGMSHPIQRSDLPLSPHSGKKSTKRLEITPETIREAIEALPPTERSWAWAATAAAAAERMRSRPALALASPATAPLSTAPLPAEEFHVLFAWAPGTTEQRKAEIVAEAKLLPNGQGIYELVSYKVWEIGPKEVIKARLDQYAELVKLSVMRPARGSFVPTDDFYTQQWDMKMMNLETAWNISRGSSSVIIAVLDSGTQLDHQEFTGRMVPGYDFVSNVSNAGDGDGPDSNPTDEIYIDNGKTSHGTHVTGTIGANANNLGTVGVDHNCKIMPVRVLGVNNKGTLGDIIAGLVYAADLQDVDLAPYGIPPLSPTRPRPIQSARVINISIELELILSAPTALNYLNDHLAAIKAKGIIVVVAAGNDNKLITGPNYVVMPAASPSVITVGAVTNTVDRASYSNFGSALDIVAPGGASTGANDPSRDILSTNKGVAGGGYRSIAGTSMACPHVAGVCGLMLAVNPTLTPDEIQLILQGTAYKYGLSSGRINDQLGHGFILADNAVRVAASLTPPVDLVVHTAGLTFALDQTEQSFAASNANGTFLQLGVITTSIAYDQLAFTGWFSGLSAVNQGTNSRTYTVTVSRLGLPDGTYTATLTLTSANGGSETISLTLIVQAVVPTPPFSQVFVLLIDLNDNTANNTKQRALVLPNRSFAFSNVPPGDYILVAGTDLNNDGYIDDTGEYFGVYAVSTESARFTTVAGVNVTGAEIPMYLQEEP